MTNTYQRLHALHYDLVYAAKPYAEEAAFVAERLPGPPATLLDLACGTARHALAFAELGYSVVGVDYSPDLLERAAANVAASPHEIELVEADMREVDLGRRFDAVTCLFDSIGYPQSDDGIVAVLGRARTHLVPGGTLVLEHLHAPAMLASYAPTRVRRWHTGAGTLIRVSETELDAERSVMTVNYELIELRDDGSYEHEAERQSNRFFTAEEMRELVERAGLGDIRSEAAYVDDTTIADDTFHVLVTARP